MNIPSRTKDGKLVRGCFIADDGMSLSAWDLDQIEMRILAHESQDENLIRLFVEGESCGVRKQKGKCTCHDIHLLTASLIYQIPIDEVTDEQRTLAKNIGFGIVYGITAKGLQAQMSIRGQERSEAECQEMIDAYLTRAYPGVARYMDRMAAEARQQGYVVDMFGRMRYLAAVHSTVKHVAAEAVRQAGNHPIQAGAQGVIKLAMADIHRKTLKLRKKGYRVNWLLQEHDALMCEHDAGLEELLDPIVKKAMSNAAELLVPISSKGGLGARTWAELK
jgi:DNA polymerase I